MVIGTYSDGGNPPAVVLLGVFTPAGELNCPALFTFDDAGVSNADLRFVELPFVPPSVRLNGVFGTKSSSLSEDKQLKPQDKKER